MIELLGALPNLHPLVVHFPIALLVAAPLLDLLSLLTGRTRGISASFSASATVLFVLGAAGAGLAFLSGRAAVTSVMPPASAETLLADHESWGERTMWLAILYSMARLAIVSTRAVDRPWVRVLLLLAGLIPGVSVLGAADRGGRLVYTHAVGVRRVERPMEEPAGSSREEAPADMTPTAARPDAITWLAGPGAGQTLRGSFELAAGSWDGVRTSMTSGEGGMALVLEWAGPGPLLLLAAPSLGDLQVEATIDVSGFDGLVGLVHHHDASGYDMLALTGDRVELRRVREGRARTLDRSGRLSMAGLRPFRAVSAGGHLRAYLDTRMVAHGHAPAASPGRTGILLDGRGAIRLRSFTASALGQPIE